MKKRPRFLPRYVTSFRDRHGKLRYRYRRKGRESGYFKADLGTDEFRAEYAAFEARSEPVKAGPREGTIDDLVARYLATPSRLGPTETTQRRVASILNRFRNLYGKAIAIDVEFGHIDDIVAAAAQKTTDEKGRAWGGIEAARKLRKELIRLFDYAEKIRMIPAGSNPARQADRVKVSPGRRSTGFHTWTEGEIAKFREHHKLGTNARLALELMLWTGQRKIDALRLGPGDLTGGRIRIAQSKTGKALDIVLAPALLEAIAAMPPRPGASTFLVTDWGEPFSPKGFGNRMRDWCDAAGLPHCTSHGLRKAMMRRMAELGLGNQTLKSVSGHSRDDEVATYTKAADQAKMAADAIAVLAKWEAQVSNPKV